MLSAGEVRDDRSVPRRRPRRCEPGAGTALGQNGNNHNNNHHLQEVSAIKKESDYQLMFKDYPDVVSAVQMCEMLGGISIKTGYELLKSGKVKSFLVGCSYRIPKLFILEYMGL